MWTQIILLLQEQSDLYLHFLSKRLEDDRFCIGDLRVDKCEFQFIS